MLQHLQQIATQLPSSATLMQQSDLQCIEIVTCCYAQQIKIHVIHYNRYATHYIANGTYNNIYMQHITLQTEHTTIYMQHITLQMEHATIYMQHSTLQTEHTTIYMQHITLQMERTTIYMQHVVIQIQHITTLMQHITLQHIAVQMQHNKIQMKQKRTSINTCNIEQIHAKFCPFVSEAIKYILFTNLLTYTLIDLLYVSRRLSVSSNVSSLVNDDNGHL